MPETPTGQRGIGLKSIFWNHQESRFRAGWRVLLIVVAVGVVSTMLSGPGVAC
jgi:hypothetical protein